MSVFFIPKLKLNACWINNKSKSNILTESECGMRTMKIDCRCLKMLSRLESTAFSLPQRFFFP